MPALPLDDLTHGLLVIRASRLEALLDPLVTLLDAVPPAGVLAPQTVIAAHPGMRQWLSGALARRRGPAGIVANLDIALPSSWLDALARDLLGEAAVALAPYRRERLRWRIHELLPTLEEAQVRVYLAGGDPARRRYQLADRLARLYSQYLVYRPDWLAAWQAGRDDVPETTFLAPLWRAVRQAIDKPHRAEVLRELLVRLQRGRSGLLPDEPLHVFGLSHLAPAELAVLSAVARHRPVVLYVPDPCREFWSGLRGERARLREALERPGEAGEAAFIEASGHPLLAEWGRMGQQFMLLLSGQADVRLDVRHWRDEDARDRPAHLLGRLQESIRRLEPAWVAPAAGAAGLADASLRVHLCHTRLRELEVLRDALLQALADDPGLQPSDIVVMAPDIGAYVPLLPAVFGAAGRYHGPLPYHLADVATARAHPILEAFLRLLDTPGERLTAAQVLDLLQTPAIALALGLGGGEIELIGRWLAEARVAWALDPDWRRGFQVPPLVEHTFAWGMDRLLAGYAMGGDAPAELPDGELWPVGGVQGPQAAALGGLDRLLQAVAGLHADAATPRSASAWATRFEHLLDGLFRVATDDHAGREALAVLRRMIQATVVETADASLDPLLDFDVARDVLRERLAATPERQRFLLGGVTVCGMVPQRAIPFRVIAVIGLNDGEFPRNSGDAGLDPMLRHPRLGDRDVRSDDRYLFLETVMAARERLHLSYLGEGVRDGKPRNPAAPLAELLDFLDAQAGLAGRAPAEDDLALAEGRPQDMCRPWRVKHPLQPFDARYFGGTDPRLVTFRTDFAGMVAQPGRADEGDALPDPAAPPRVLPLKALTDWYRDPARQLLRQRMDVRLDALESARLAGSEPLAPAFEAIDRVGRELVLEALAGDLRLPRAAPARLRLTGKLPPGRPGEVAWLTEREKAQVLLEQAREHPLLHDGLPPRQPVPLDLTVAGTRLHGELSRVHPRDGTRWLFEAFPGREEKQLGFRERVPLFIEWALLRRVTPPDTGVRLCVLTAAGAQPWQDRLNAWDTAYLGADASARAVLEADLDARLGVLLTLWHEAQQHPVRYFPRTSWAVAECLARDKTPDPATAWFGAHQRGECDQAPGYARLLAGELSLEPGSPDHTALLETARRLQQAIEPEAAA